MKRWLVIAGVAIGVALLAGVALRPPGRGGRGMQKGRAELSREGLAMEMQRPAEGDLVVIPNFGEYEFKGTTDEEITREASEWAARDPEKAAAWAERIERLDLRDHVVAAVAAEWADHDPKAAAGFLLERGPLQDNAVIGIAERLAAKDPTRASEWAAKFPEGIRERAQRQVERVRERGLRGE